MAITTSGTSITFNDSTVQITAAMNSGAAVNATSSSELTLTNTSAQYQVVQITSVANSVVNLPSATTVTTKGFPVFVIENVGLAGVPLQIKNNAGTFIGVIPVGSVATIALEDNSTAAGVWSINSIEAVTTFQSNTSSITTASITTIANGPLVVGLTSSLFVRCWLTTSGGTVVLNTQAVTISGSTLTIGTTQTSSAGSNESLGSLALQAMRLSATALVFKVVLAGYNGGNDQDSVQARSNVATVSGTTLTFGTWNSSIFPTIANLSGFGDSSGNLNNGTMVRLSDTSFCAAYNTGSTGTYPKGLSGSLAHRTITVSGTTMTIGAQATLGTSTFSQVLSLVALSSTASLICYGQGTSGNASGRTKFVVVSISGTTSTFNTEVSYETSDVLCQSNGSPSPQKAVAVSSTQALMASAYFLGSVTVSGTTPTVQMINTKINNNNLGGIAGFSSIHLTTATKAVLLNSDITNPSYYVNINGNNFSLQKIDRIATSPIVGNGPIFNGIATSSSLTTTGLYAQNLGYGSPLGAEPTTSFIFTPFVGATTGGSVFILGNSL